MLLKQETSEAKSTVDGRLSYIETEMYDRDTIHRGRANADVCSKRVEGNIKDVQAKTESKRSEVYHRVHVLLLLAAQLTAAQIMRIQAQIQQPAGQA